MSPVCALPTRGKDLLRQLGPGLIITAVIVGSGELIVTPKLGADVGFKLLWFIIIGCVLKVFVQVELGRIAMARGVTTLEAMNLMPGPRWVASWLVWFWLLMYLALVFQVAGMVGGIAKVFAVAGSTWSETLWGFIVAGSCAVLLVSGRYRVVERLSVVMVALFTLCTIVALAALQWTPYAITTTQVLSGLKFQLPASFNTAFAAFGIIGVGASELIYYPYWCLEKGYAKHVGPNDQTAGWLERARGWIGVMRVDAWVSCTLYTSVTVAFYLLGAAVLSGKNLKVGNEQMIETLSHMYRETFGAWGMTLFLVGAFAVLYSTVFGATASNARLFADALAIFGLRQYHSAEQRQTMVRVGCVLLPFASLTVYLIWGAPVSLVFVGALAQGLMLPFLALAALYFRFRLTESALRPGRLWTALLASAALAMAAVGAYQVVEQVQKVLQRG